MMKFSCILATLAVVIVSGAALSTPAADDCTYLTYNMMDCAEYLLVGGHETTPQAGCCLGLKILVEANPKCVCFALNLADNLGLRLNITRSLALPSYCGVSAPSFSTCNDSGFPDGSPAPSPSPLPPPSSIGVAPAPTYRIENAPAPAPSKSSSGVPRPAISSISAFILIVSAVLLFIHV